MLRPSLAQTGHMSELGLEGELCQSRTIGSYHEDVGVHYVVDRRCRVAFNCEPLAVGRKSRVGETTFLIGKDKCLLSFDVIDIPYLAASGRRVSDAVESFRVIRDKANIVAGSARCECAVLSVERPYRRTISRLA